MEPKFNTSFIPKKSLQADVSGSKGTSKYTHRRTIYGPGFFLMLLIFTITVVVALGVFGYTKILIRDIEGKIAKMEEQKNSFDLNSVNMLTEFDTKIRSAKKILASHVAVSGLFDLLENITLKKVQYTELVYNGFPNEVPTITVTGVSDGFQNIALQTEQYRKDTSLLNPVVNDLEKKENMTIDFSVDMEADRRLTSFSSFLNRPDTKINEVYSPEVTDAMIDNGTTTATTTENNLSEDF